MQSITSAAFACVSPVFFASLSAISVLFMKPSSSLPRHRVEQGLGRIVRAAPAE
jgi:hypothetical protein